MCRSLIALRIQTPTPILCRINPLWFYAALALLVLLIVVVSTRTALLYRAEVKSLQARVVYVSKANRDRRQQRAAALIAYEALGAPVTVQPRPAEAKIVRAAEPSRTKPRRVVQPAGRERIQRIHISTHTGESAPPSNTKDAFHSLLQERNEVALQWLVDRPARFANSPEWERFRQRAVLADSAHGQYQLGVLYGALGENARAYHWSRLAASASPLPRYLRAYAVAADKVGERVLATEAYRRYLRLADSKADGDIRSRLATLEQQR